MKQQGENMDDSLVLAKLTLMLLRASVSHPESLSADYRVIISPPNEVLSRDAALMKLAAMTGELEVAADTMAGDLRVTVHQPTHEDMIRLGIASETFLDGVRSLNAGGEPDALVKAVGFAESMLIPVSLVEQWVQLVDCSDCPMSLGRPGPGDPTGVVAVLYFGGGGRGRSR